LRALPAIELGSGGCIRYAQIGAEALLRNGYTPFAWNMVINITDPRGHNVTLFVEPDDTIAHTKLGIALAAKGELDKAISHYKKGLENEPDYVNALINLGVALGAQNELDESISYFQKVLDIEPNSAPAHYNLGFALKLQGNLDEAIAHLQESMSIDPNDGRAETMLKTLMQEQNSETPDEEN